MNEEPSEPVARLTMVTLGVSNMRASIAFYEALGFARKFKVTGEAVAFFEPAVLRLACFPGINLRRMSPCRGTRDRRRFARPNLRLGSNSLVAADCSASPIRKMGRLFTPSKSSE